MKREPYTDTQNRALCMKYRKGGACRRLATRLVIPPKNEGKARCEECAGNLPVKEVSPKGFKIVTTGRYSGHPLREYRRIN